MKHYIVTFLLLDSNRQTQVIYAAADGEDEQGMKERLAMMYEDKFDEPIRCTKIVKVKEYDD